MRLFNVWGKYEKGQLSATFSGYFVQREGPVIEGYLEETQGISFIKGLYDEEKNQLAFVKMSNTSLSHPLAYVFRDLGRNGVWSSCTMRRGFFQHGTISGPAFIDIIEVYGERYEHATENAIEVFNRHAACATAHNQDLMNEVHCLREFLDNPI